MFSTVRIRPEFTFSPAQQITCWPGTFASQMGVTKRDYPLSEYCDILHRKDRARPQGDRAQSRPRKSRTPSNSTCAARRCHSWLCWEILVEPVAPHGAEAILVDFTNSCGFLELGFPRKAPLFAASSDSTRISQFAADERERAQFLIGVDELWRPPSWKHGRLRIVGDDFSDDFVLLDDPECKSEYDFVGVAFFDAHQTWGEIALASRRHRAAFSKDYIQ